MIKTCKCGYEPVYKETVYKDTKEIDINIYSIECPYCHIGAFSKIDKKTVEEEWSDQIGRYDPLISSANKRKDPMNDILEKLHFKAFFYLLAYNYLTIKQMEEIISEAKQSNHALFMNKELEKYVDQIIERLKKD